MLKRSTAVNIRFSFISLKKINKYVKKEKKIAFRQSTNATMKNQNTKNYHSTTTQ